MAFARRCYGVHGARVALLLRPMAFYDKSTEKDEQKDMQILSQKQTNHCLNGMHILPQISFNMSVEQQAGLLLVCDAGAAVSNCC